VAELPIVDLLAATWTSIVEVCEGLEPADWEAATDCPGWSVRDQLAHVVGTESALLGRPAPPPAPEAPHVKNPIGGMNEAWVESFRGRPGPEVLAAFREVTALRLAALRAMSEEQMDAETLGPVGPQPYREFMQIRLMDSWVHEQDVCRATGRPGHFEGPAAEAAFSRLTTSLPFVVGKKSGAADGAVVSVRLDGPLARTLTVGVDGGRARFVDDGSVTPSVTLSMNTETYACLATGRWMPGDVVDRGLASIEGDQVLGRTVLEQLDVIP
jgi:uncharacterized protein (TIGR03083 family)